MIQRRVYAQSFEGLSRGLQADFTPALKNALRDRGVDFDKLQPSYPYEQWEETVLHTAQTIFSGKPLEESLRQMGALAVQGYESTIVGRLLLRAFRVFGPRQVLMRAQNSLRSTNNYTETRLTERGATEFELWINFVGQLGALHVGIIREALRFAGVTEPQVDMLPCQPTEGTYRILWK